MGRRWDVGCFSQMYTKLEVAITINFIIDKIILSTIIIKLLATSNSFSDYTNDSLLLNDISLLSSTVYMYTNLLITICIFTNYSNSIN